MTMETATGWQNGAVPDAATSQSNEGDALPHRGPTRRRTRRSVLLASGAAAGVGGGGGGCGAQATPPAPAAKTAEPMRLELTTDWNTVQRKAVLDVMKDEYMQRNPHVTVEHHHASAPGGNAEGYHEKIVAQLSAGTVSDIVADWDYKPFVPELVDLTKDAPAAGWKKAGLYYNPHDQEVSGKLYMLAMSASVTGWVYNKSLFAAAGIKEPDATWTLDTVLDAAKRLTKPDRQEYGVLAAEGPWNGWLELLWAAGAGARSATSAEVFSAERKKTRLAEAGGPDAFQWYLDLIHKHQVAPTPAVAREQGVSFTAGKVAMQPFGISQSSGAAQTIGSNFTWSAMFVPKYPGTGKRASDLTSAGFVFPRLTKDRGSYETALQYTLSFYTDPVMKKVAEQRSTLPIVRKWIESPDYLSAPPKNLDVIVKIVNDKQLVTGDHQDSHKSFRMWLAALRRETDRAFSGENAPRPALAAAVAAADQVLASA